MNSRQKELLKKAGLSEADVIAQLKKEFDSARDNVLEKIKVLESKDLTESVKNQIKYKNALVKQIDDIYSKLTPKTVKTIDDYLKVCYEDGFIGTMYDIAGQGIPLIIPINQEDMVNAIINDTKLSKSLYKSMGFAVDSLKKKVNVEVARGIAMGSSYIDVARNIRNKANIGIGRSMVIARTEGHRVRMQSTFEAQKKAKDEGADVVKQWDSTQDRKTRSHHQQLDGQIQEIDDPFEIPSSGRKAMHPGAFGVPSEDINCRCAILQRARWALDDDELETLKERAAFYGLDKTKDFDDFKKKYLKAAEKEYTESNGSSSKGWKDTEYQSKVSSKAEAISYFNKDAGIKFSDSKKYPIDETLAVGCANWHDRFNIVFKEFESANPVRIPTIKVKAPKSMGMAGGYYRYYSSAAKVEELALNAGHYRSMDAMTKLMTGMVERKWQSGSSPMHIFVHEYGHHVSNSMKWITGNQNWQGEFIRECVAEFKKVEPSYVQETYIGLSDHLSRYAVSSESEVFAEAFAEYFSEDEPRTFAKIFGEKLEEILKGVGKI